MTALHGIAVLTIGRVAVSSLLDLESKYNRAIEEKTLLEQEIVLKQEVEEECQRLKDDVRGASSFAPLSALPC